MKVLHSKHVSSVPAWNGRGADSLFNSPNSFAFDADEAAPQKLFRNAGKPRQLCNCVVLPHVVEKGVCRSVVPLLLPCGPSAIVRRISFRVIYALKRKFSLSARLLSHVCKEVAEIFPSVADGYAARFIVFIRRITWERASINHVSPRGICSSASPFASVSVLSHCYPFVINPLDKLIIA